MVRHKGYKNKTRRLLRKDARNHGLPSFSRFLVDYKVGDKVDIIADPTFQTRGFPHRHFYGRTGTVVGIRGRCYEVKVNDLGKMKMIIIGKEHIRISNAGKNEIAAKNQVAN